MIIFFYALFFCTNYKRVLSKPIQLEGNFQYCLPTDILINNSDPSFGTDLLNDFNLYKSFQKEYFHIYLPFNESLNIYTLNGNLFLANCSIAKKIWVPTLVNICTSGILVFLNTDFKEQVFLNLKNKIITNETVVIDCTEEVKTTYLENIRITQFSNKISINKTNMSYAKVNKSFSKKTLDESILSVLTKVERIENNYDMEKIILNAINISNSAIPEASYLKFDSKTSKMLKQFVDELDKLYNESSHKNKILILVTFIPFFVIILFFVVIIIFLKIIIRKFIQNVFNDKNQSRLDDISIRIDEVNPEKQNKRMDDNKETEVLNTFIKYFTNLSKEDFNKVIIGGKKIQTSALVDVSKVRLIKKGIDFNMEILEAKKIDVYQFFNKSGSTILRKLLLEFEEAPYYCSICYDELFGKSVACDLCFNWYHMKCADNVGKQNWYCKKCINNFN